MNERVPHLISVKATMDTHKKDEVIDLTTVVLSAQQHQKQTRIRQYNNSILEENNSAL
jgi:hypothetical protein